MEKTGIVFMGTSTFAVPALTGLVEAGWPIIAVVTPPDRPQGRGRITAPPPLKITAGELGLPLIQTKNVKDKSFLETFKSLAPEMAIVAAFGQILPKPILYDTPRGCINIHPSLLPKYRGAAPINWTIINGEKTTGVTIMKLDTGIDSGDILLQEETPIGENENFGELHRRLAEMGAKLLLKTISLSLTGNLHPQRQDHSLATFAPPLGRELGLINWEDDCQKIARLIRGLSPTPCAYTFFHQKKLKIFSATAKTAPTSEAPGVIIGKRDGALCIAAANGCVYLTDLQLEGKKRMSSEDFLRGAPVSAGEKIGRA
ncbi:MAG: methionyl-tRNA formyltransferase [Syntrophobacterales bacterium]|nr:methionyl-tRNA formyltransferase [Syntrophobacterales bacterium]